MTDYGNCYECTGNGDDYKIDVNGNLVCNCEDCPFNPDKAESEEQP